MRQSDDMALPLRSCFLLLTVLALTVAMIPMLPNGYVGTLSPLTLAGAVLGGAFGVGACLSGSRCLTVSLRTIRFLCVGACLALAVPNAIWLAIRGTSKLQWEEAAVILVGLLLAGVTARSKRMPCGILSLTAYLAVLLTGEAVFCATTVRPYTEAAAAPVRLAALVGFLLTATLLVHLGDRQDRHRRLLIGQLLLLFIAGAAVRWAALEAVADSGIDVHEALRAGSARLLSGQDPYGAEYVQHGEAIQGAPFYPPLPLLLCAPFRAAGLDVRLANLVCDLIAALALFVAGGQRLGGALLAAIYLHFPRAPLILTLAWYEPMLAALLGWGLLLAWRGWWVGFLLLGIGVTGKQYGIVLLAPLLAATRQRWAVIPGVAAATLLILAPFFCWGPSAFLKSVVVYHLNLPARANAVNLQGAALYLWGHELPRVAMALAALLVIGWLAWSASRQGELPAAWMAACLVIFCLLHTQAFINYYYLCQFLVLLGLASFSRETPASA